MNIHRHPSVERAAVRIAVPDLLQDDRRNPEESPHQKVFRLVGERRFEEAARLAKRLIDAGDVDGFFIYRDTPKLRAAKGWLEQQAKAAQNKKQADWHKITPERAQVLIEANPDNRRIDAEGLADRLRDMADGAWAENGETVIVSKCRHLNDGQHRCWAALLLGKSFSTAMSWGVERDSRATVNTGVIRRGGDRLGFDGITDSKNKSATASLTHMFYVGRKPTRREEQEYYHAQAGDIESAHQVVKSTVRGGSVAAFRVAAIELMRRGYVEAEIEEFMAMVRRGDKSRTRGCAAFSLYQGIAVEKKRYKPIKWVPIICYHFECWRAKRQLGTLATPEMAAVKG